MKKILFIISAAAMLLCGSCSHEEYECDVCVYGGTSSGVIAAYAVAKQGKKVLLVEPAYRLGGLSSGGLGMTDIGNKQVVKGLSLDFYRRVGQHYGALEQWIFEPSVAESIFKGYIERGQVEVLYGHRILEATKQDTQLTSIKLENVEKFCGRATVKAKVYIDCSYEGDLMARSGVSYTVGREPNSQYNENWNGVQMRQYHQFPDGVDPYVVEGDPESGLLWGISPEPLAEQGSGDSKVQAYNYRMCLTDVKENAIPITRPDDYDSTKYELLLRLIKAKGDNSIHSYLHFSHMPNRKTDINNNGGFSSDMIGMNHNYPEASYKEREKIIEAHRSYTFGLLWFLGHDERVPEKIRNEMLRWGLPKDEYVEYGHWTPQLYIREARRMVGEYVTTQANCDNRTTVEDGIGMAAYTMDSHNCQRVVIVKDGKAMVKNEGDVQIHGGLPYDISYRSITPKREECTNLLVPVCLSASHIAYGSIRMEPVFMLLGQSAAKAACLAIDGGVKVQEVDYRDIQRMYEVDPLLDGTAADIVIDDTAIEVDEKSDWKRIKANNGYGRSYFTLDPVRGERRLRFPFEVKESGKYKVYTYYINLWNAGTKVTELEFFDGKQKQTLWLDAAKIVVKGQTSGEWVLLGEYELSAGEKGYVDFTNNGKVTGKVVADAVLLVKSK
ncbi:MAG: FAD-dependent oxidoreductase [Alistipes sp.]|nr:FAD-dependent oxidoreductase [Alistipes sp.]